MLTIGIIYGIILLLVIMFVAAGTYKPTPKQEDEKETNCELEG